jgi:ATP-binding protein involved in chromosome partitioning
MALFAQILAGTDWGELDVLLLDLPPGTERTVQFVETITSIPPLTTCSKTRRFGLVMVTIPSAIARGVVARTLSALAELDRPDREPAVLGYVENMAGYYCHDCGAVRPLFPEADPEEAPLDAPCLGRIPFDPELATLCDRGWPEDDLPKGAGERGAADSTRGLAGALHAVDAVARRLLAETTESPSSQPNSQPTHQEAPR